MRQTDLHRFPAAFWNPKCGLDNLHRCWGYPIPESRGADSSEL